MMTEFIIESGVAKGVDALVKFKSKKLYIWAVYSIGSITRNDGTTELTTLILTEGIM